MKKVCLLFGGKSLEHEVSIMSAKNVYGAIDTSVFEVILVYINKVGDFLRSNSFEEVENKINLVGFDMHSFKDFDIVFPVMHGPNCEDGSIQGFLSTLGVKYVGPKVLSSAICMDKDIQKQIARHNGIVVTDWIAIKDFEYANIKEGILNEIRGKIEQDFKYPIFVKPSRMGSSVGVVKVKTEDALEHAINNAFTYDNKIIIEKAVIGREIEVAVLGKEYDLIISNPGEVVSLGNHEFYDYDAKYIDEHGSKTYIPAQNISAEIVEEYKMLSKKIYTMFECEGLARIDFFLTNEGRIVLNEINTLPGFTNISMYPKLMEEMGVSYRDVITKLLSV